jgi:hypothetical protein
MSAHNNKAAGPIAKIQTVLESAHRGEGPIFLKTFYDFFFLFFLNSFILRTCFFLGFLAGI